MTTKKKDEVDEKAEDKPVEMRPEFPVAAPASVPTQTVEQALHDTALAMSACLNKLEAILKDNVADTAAPAGIANSLAGTYAMMTKLLTQPR